MRRRESEYIAARLNRLDKPASMWMVFEGERDGLAVVRTEDGNMAIPFVGTVQATPGESVLVELRNGSYVCLGPSVFKPARGTVVEFPDEDFPTRIIVQLSDGSMASSERITGYTPTLGDSVALMWSIEGPLIIGAVSGMPVVEPRPPSPPPARVYAPSPFPPSHLGGWQGGGFQPGGHLLVSDTWVTGAWWDQIADTIEDNAGIRAAAVYMSPTAQQSGALPKMQLLNGPQTIYSPHGAEAPITAQPGWNAVPNTWLDLMKSSRNYGIAFIQSTPGQGFHIYNAQNADPLSFSMKVEWFN